MNETKNNRMIKMNRDKGLKERGKEIRKAHKKTDRLSERALFKITKNTQKDYFPNE
jgi:hypothetical protein